MKMLAKTLVIASAIILPTIGYAGSGHDHNTNEKSVNEQHKSGAEEHRHDGTESADHHASKTATAGGIQGTGKVISVDTEKRTIKMAHDPIKALNWPKMTMSFPVETGVDISSYQAGDAVSFTLNPTSKTIVNLKKGQ